MATVPKLAAPVTAEWEKIHADGTVSVYEWWKLILVVVRVAVVAASELVGMPGKQRLEWATDAVLEFLIWYAPNLTGKIAAGSISATIKLARWVGWSWPIFQALLRGVVKANVQTEYDKQTATAEAAILASKAAILEEEISLLRRKLELSLPK